VNVGVPVTVGVGIANPLHIVNQAVRADAVSIHVAEGHVIQSIAVLGVQTAALQTHAQVEPVMHFVQQKIIGIVHVDVPLTVGVGIAKHAPQHPH